MFLIYEKKDGRVLIKTEDMPETNFGTERAAAYNDRTAMRKAKTFNDKNIQRRIRAMRKRRHRLRRAVYVAAFVVLTVALGAGILDGRFDGAVKNAALPFGSLSLYEAHGSAGRTIYTMEYTDDKSVYQKPSQDITIQSEESNVFEKVAATDNVLPSGANLDGVNYFPITDMDLSCQSVFAISNGTSFNPDTESISEEKPECLTGLELTNQPLVLIVHTHAGECYTEYSGMYPEGESTRTTDENKNVVRVGKEIADTLSEFGICVIHSEARHDEKSFINAYSESAKTVRKYLEEYPSIRFVVDVHRDAIIRDDGESIKAVKEIAGQKYAQLMFVVGTNELGHSHPDWQNNLSFAMTLQQSIESTYPGLCRNINLRDVPFNQQLSDGYVLLEVGTNSNTLEEALLSARAFGENLARIIYENIE